jgi:glutamine phosphoribosylpyrophosphate amidotransferase
MCGVIGAVINQANKTQAELLSNLFVESRVRGLHSFGWAVNNQEGVQVFHDTLLTMIDEVTKLVHPCLFLGHCRYSTSGDTPQPLNISGVQLAFNGNIHMGTKEEIEKHFLIDMITDNDGEVFAQAVIAEHCDLVQLISNPAISFAGVWLYKHKLWALRNERRPLYWSTDNYGNIYIASTEDIFVRAGFTNSIRLFSPNKIRIMGDL